MKQFVSRFGGIILGSFYGLLFRFGFDYWQHHHTFTDLFSISFIWILPIVIGVIPMLFASQKQLASYWYIAGAPALSVFLFFLYCFMTRIEDIACVVIIAFPFVLGAALGGLMAARLILRYRKKKGILYSLILLPLLTGVVEARLPTPSNVYEIRTPVRVQAPAARVWEHVIRVKEIKEAEYSKGFFYYAGIPRPLYAELDRDTVGATRTGHFDGGLTFRERVTEWQRNRKVSFSIEVIPDSSRNTVFERHVLKGNHFRFLNASYELKPVSDKETELTLVCSYQLDTRINGYGSFWGNRLLTDFQKRLLEVIKKRCDEP